MADDARASGSGGPADDSTDSVRPGSGSSPSGSAAAPAAEPAIEKPAATSASSHTADSSASTATDSFQAEAGAKGNDSVAGAPSGQLRPSGESVNIPQSPVDPGTLPSQPALTQPNSGAPAPDVLAGKPDQTGQAKDDQGAARMPTADAGGVPAQAIATVPAPPGAVATENGLLQERFREQLSIYGDCAYQAQSLWWLSRLLVQAWLSEIHLKLAKLERLIYQLTAVTSPPTTSMDSAWQQLLDIMSALDPAAGNRFAKLETVAQPTNVQANVKAVGWRLQVVFLFLLLQIGVGVGLLLASVRQLESTDSLRAPVQDSQAPGAGDVAATATKAANAVDGTERPRAVAPGSSDDVNAVTKDTTTAADAPPSNARTAQEPQVGPIPKSPDAADKAASRSGAGSSGSAHGSSEYHPYPIQLIVLGSLLGMITITIHLNWKFRNRWDTLGFLPWYLTRLVGAPVISIAVLAFLFQVSVSTTLTSGSGGAMTSLGLRGAAPILIFAVAVISGLFSNRMFDWLGEQAGARTSSSASSDKPATPTSTATKST